MTLLDVEEHSIEDMLRKPVDLRASHSMSSNRWHILMLREFSLRDFNCSIENLMIELCTYLFLSCESSKKV